MPVEEANAVLGVIIYPVLALINLTVAWYIMRMVRARTKAAQAEESLHLDRVSRLWRIFCRQRDLIDQVIAEIDNHQPSYPTFPPDLMEALMSVHTDGYDRAEADPALGR